VIGMTTGSQPHRTPRGYLQPVAYTEGAGYSPGEEWVEFFDDSVVEGPVSLDQPASADSGCACVTPAVAVVVRRALSPHAGQGTAAHAVGAALLALELRFADQRPVAILLGERVIDLPLRGPLTLTMKGGETHTYPAEEFGDIHDRLRSAADQVGGLRPGDMAVFGPRTTEPARTGAGPVELWGPQESTLINRIQD
jgi:hypothetical protein